jgi:3-phenylpropionate/trans-cinnamate dioxygenase ferredoxin subunit
MDPQQLRWVKVAESIEGLSFPANNIAEVTVDGKLICLARFNNGLFAFAPKCPHASGRFVDGYLDVLGNVVCPIHRYKFCLKNGRNVTGEGYYLKHWPVKVVEEGVFVGLEMPSLFDLA